MSLGVCHSDEVQAQEALYKSSGQFCQIMNERPRITGLPAYIQPPRNSTRWVPGLNSSLVIPVAPTGVDLLVFSERVPLGYDGILTALTNVWTGTGFVEASADITWRVKQDRRFIPYFDEILTTLGSLAIPFVIAGQGIPLLSGQLLQYFANFQPGSEGRLNVGGKTVCALSGYIWPRERTGR